MASRRRQGAVEAQAPPRRPPRRQRVLAWVLIILLLVGTVAGLAVTAILGL